MLKRYGKSWHILVLFLFLWNYIEFLSFDVGCGLMYIALLCLSMSLVSLISLRLCSWRGFRFCQRLPPTQHLMKWLCVFFLLVCLYGRFSSVEPSLHLWEEAFLTMVDLLMLLGIFTSKSWKRLVYNYSWLSLFVIWVPAWLWPHRRIWQCFFYLVE